MNTKNFLINFKDLDQQTNQHYYDQAIAIHAVKEQIEKKTGLIFYLYDNNEDNSEIWDTLEDDLMLYPNRIQLFDYVFDSLETGKITYEEEKAEFVVKPALSNAIYYYHEYQVALCKIPIYQSHEDCECELVFASNEDSLIRFLNYVNERQRGRQEGYVDVFTDEKRGLKRQRVKITQMVEREDVLLENELKKQIYRFIDEFFKDNGYFFQKYNIPYKRGILLYGKPGNGKTTLVKSIAGSISAPVIYWQITEHTDSESIKEIFRTIFKLAPVVLVIEDIDSMPKSTRSYFLNTLDGAVSKEGIFLIGTTNYPEKIDPALINRAGRFDRAYELKAPGENLRKDYLRKRKVDQFISDEQLDEVVRRSEEFSFAQLNELYTSIALEWHYENEVNIENVISELQLSNKKSQKRDWFADPNTGKVGFY